MGNGTVLVTGGSRGIGAAVALGCAAKGHDVALTYLEDDASATAVVAAVERLGRRACAVQGDTADELAVPRFIDAARELAGPLVGLVNNAGIIGQRGRVFETTPAIWRRVLAVNVVGLMHCAQAAASVMSTERGGRGGCIVNISSAAATLGSAGEYVHYAASKAAVDAFTLGFAQEVAREGVRVVGVSPGFVETEIHARSGAPDRLERLAPSLPLGRAGLPQEVADSVVWLLGDEASYVTGATLRVAGGR